MATFQEHHPGFDYGQVVDRICSNDKEREANSLHLASQMPKEVTTLELNKPKKLVTKEEDAKSKKKKMRSIKGKDVKLTEGLETPTDWWNAMVVQHPPRPHRGLPAFLAAATRYAGRACCA
ncbi:hypothetical protein G7054_g10422 [Neopestalotiopsis clavispora]|nr:hypothetical protein G7054_g10422 [Neopestalotiopsis clavispora]